MRGFFRLVLVALLVFIGAIIGDKWGVPDWARSLPDWLVAQSQSLFADKHSTEYVPGTDEESWTDPPDTKEVAVSTGTPDMLPLCPGMNISNKPRNKNGVVTAPLTFSRKGISLNVNVAPGACLSSGYGMRNGKLHKGIDLHNENGVPVIAAGDGVIKEAGYRDDFGNYIFISHDDKLFTLYAHLRSVDTAIKPGASVSASQRLGMMGNTASYKIPVHVHLEIREGNYETQAGIFGLTPLNPFSG